MKRVIKYIAILLVAIILPVKTLAAGSITASPTNVTITKGGSANVTVKANNAAGRLDISSSNAKIATVGTSSVFLDNQSQTIKIRGKEVGSTTVVIKKTDVATYDSQVLTGNIVINVKVVEKVASKPTTPASKPTTTTETKENTETKETKKSEAYEITLLGVKKVETSLLRSDFDTVKEMVNSLKSEEEKKELLDRLNLAEPNLKELKNEVAQCDVCEKCEKSSNTLWIIISAVLLLLLIAESIYLFLKKRNMYDYS